MQLILLLFHPVTAACISRIEPYKDKKRISKKKRRERIIFHIIFVNNECVCLPFLTMSIRKSESDVKRGFPSSFITCISAMSDRLISNLYKETDTLPYTK